MVQRKTLTNLDEQVWNQFVDKVVPLSDPCKKVLPCNYVASASRSPFFEKPQCHTQSKVARSNRLTVDNEHGLYSVKTMDRVTLLKIIKNRIKIDDTIDLHGKTQEQALEALYYFFSKKQILGQRTLLVITGKGMEKKGVLRQQLPLWLGCKKFKSFISSVHEANGRHGGSGAFYVRIKKMKVNQPFVF